MPANHNHLSTSFTYQKGQYAQFATELRIGGYSVSAQDGMAFVHHPHGTLPTVLRTANAHGLVLVQSEPCHWTNTCAYDRKRKQS